MDQRDLPPLNALKAFDAAARLGSFSKAATALRIGQAAISRHVGNLEAHLGCRLFERGKSGAKLTPEGRRYHERIGPALRSIASATKDIQSDHALAKRLRISASASFALRWLTPRLPQFERKVGAPVPEVSISDTPPEFGATDCDIAIVPHAIKSAGTGWQKLFDERLIPVCHPGFANTQTWTHPCDLLNSRLIRTITRPEVWENWARALCPEKAAQLQENGPGMQDFYLSIEAAFAGDGIALVPDFLVAEALADGRLRIAADAPPFISGHAYWLVSPSDVPSRKSVNAFRKWLAGAFD